ncbi:hypothetical protein AQUCO_05600109v1 [Aquilegia coerulea]|uniref:BED-type domain-containing protein n=1 Tax=Aquilegia coerulea TaxID=218851 RepID=A0A2G5CGL5_AQUCA|nr:hypothetical protein AQUCO_05600109v1 [Aquilegia coerulea]
MSGGKKEKDPAWKYGTKVDVSNAGKTYVYLMCKFCSKTITRGVRRMKDHLAGTHENVKPCEKVPPKVKQETEDYLKQFQKKKKKGKLPPQREKEHRNQVCLDIGRFFFENGLSFNAARSPSFHNMLRSVGSYGRGLKSPSIYELRMWILQQEVKTTDEMIEEVKKTWQKTGVTIMSDGWTDIKGRTILNFLVNNPESIIFLRSVDVSDAIKDHMLFNLLDKVVEEVGEEHKAETKLMETRKGLYWTPSAAHCLDLMLEKIDTFPQHVSALHKAKRVAKFIYNHGWVTALRRKFSRRELICPTATRFATAYLSLQSILQSKKALERMFASRRWGNSLWGNKPEGKAMKKIVMKDNNFWSSLVYALKTTKPLVSVLRRVDSEKEPAMGFLYDMSQYKEIWDIINEKWDNKLHKDLHAARYYLNPQFHYEDNFSNSSDIKLGLFKCMDTLIRDPDEKERAHLELDEFTNAK